MISIIKIALALYACVFFIGVMLVGGTGINANCSGAPAPRIEKYFEMVMPVERVGCWLREVIP